MVTTQTDKERALVHALQSVIDWAIERETGSQFVANIKKPIAFDLAKKALKSCGIVKEQALVYQKKVNKSCL